MADRTENVKNNVKTFITQNYKVDEVVKSHNCLYPQGIWHIKKKYTEDKMNTKYEFQKRGYPIIIPDFCLKSKVVKALFLPLNTK